MFPLLVYAPQMAEQCNTGPSLCPHVKPNLSKLSKNVTVLSGLVNSLFSNVKVIILNFFGLRKTKFNTHCPFNRFLVFTCIFV